MVMVISVDLLVAVGVPFLVLTLLRINAAYVFLSLCLGDVLVRYVARGPESLTSFISPDPRSFGAVTIQLALLLIPAALTSVIFLFSIHGKLKRLLNTLPAATSSIFLVIIAVPFVPQLSVIASQPMWQTIQQYQSLIIAAGGVLAMLNLWSQRTGRHHDAKRV